MPHIILLLRPVAQFDHTGQLVSVLKQKEVWQGPTGTAFKHGTEILCDATT